MVESSEITKSGDHELEGDAYASPSVVTSSPTTSTKNSYKPLDIEVGDGPKIDFDRKPLTHQPSRQVSTFGMENDPNVDGGYAYVLLTACFFTIVLVSSIFYYFGVFVPIYIDVFGANQASVAWVGSIGTCFLALCGVFAGTLADRFGNDRMIFVCSIFVGMGLFCGSFAQELWTLYITQGLMIGVGGCLGYTAAVSVVSQWFMKRRGFAVGITVAGSGVGQFIMSQVTRALLTQFGWRSTLRYLALIHGVGLFVCAFVIKRRLPCADRLSFQSSLKYFGDRNFVLLFGMQVCNSLGFYMPHTFMVIYTIKKGYSTGWGVLILSFLGLASAVGRVTAGLVADYVGKLVMLRICMVLASCSMFAWIGCTNLGSIFAFAMVYGVFSGGYISLTPSVSADLFGVKNISTVVGLVYSGTAMGNLLCAPIGGFFYDAYGSYVPAISFAACCWSLGALLCLFTDARYSTVNDDAVEDAVDEDEGKEVPPTGDNALDTADLVVAVHVEAQLDGAKSVEVEGTRGVRSVEFSATDLSSVVSSTVEAKESDRA